MFLLRSLHFSFEGIFTFRAMGMLGRWAWVFFHVESVLLTHPSSHVLSFSTIDVFPPRSVCHTGHRQIMTPFPPPPPKLRVCEEISLLPPHAVSFWLSIQTPVSQDPSPKGSGLSLVCPRGSSVQGRGCGGMACNLFLISTGYTSSDAYRAVWFYIGHSWQTGRSEAHIACFHIHM